MNLKHIVLDFNGPGVEDGLNKLSSLLEVHILTADTFSTVREACLPIKGNVIDQEVTVF